MDIQQQIIVIALAVITVSLCSKNQQEKESKKIEKKKEACLLENGGSYFQSLIFTEIELQDPATFKKAVRMTIPTFKNLFD